MLERKDGWHIVNVRDARWFGGVDAFGKACHFEHDGARFPEIGVNLFLLAPDKPNCRYHRESVQEGFLVLSGRCRVLINDEERRLETWDYVHCPAGVDHVFVGGWGEEGDGPCALLAIGGRREGLELFYPENEKARAFGAEAPEPTPDPRVAYGDVGRRAPIDPPDWPPAGRR